MSNDYRDSLRALLGQILTVNTPGQNVDTIRFRVVGYGNDMIRVVSLNGRMRSSFALPDLRRALDRGDLIVVDS